MTPNLFKIEVQDDNYIYVSVNISDPIKVAESVFNSFFSEDVLYGHFKYLSKSGFKANKNSYIYLYKELIRFLSNEDVFAYEDLENEDVKTILEYEDIFFKRVKIAPDKIGKIGEYLLNIILEQYMGFDLAINKMKFLTSRNMSIFGIDTIHYCKDLNAIVFGEAKLTSSLSSGIGLIKHSLLKYEENIKQDIELHFTEDNLTDLNLPMDIFEDAIKNTIGVEEFLNKAKINEILIPLFIAHGEEMKVDDILEDLKSIPRTNFLDKNTKYLVISMPLNKSDIFAKEIYRLIKVKTLELKSHVN